MPIVDRSTSGGVLESRRSPVPDLLVVKETVLARLRGAVTYKLGSLYQLSSKERATPSHNLLDRLTTAPLRAENQILVRPTSSAVSSSRVRS